ncbi:NADH-cytochrome b5 reductase 2-like [Varroa jacobsoni]|uniref:NADH-cytochrome b5 reductase 2-like n=1 Tax=Varroa jacobsoni TaxID=62625 RepID=UPI000BF32056|nr:NADH-cytochrome b5 reductase 2-like [Varroa jacobsoni]
MSDRAMLFSVVVASGAAIAVYLYFFLRNRKVNKKLLQDPDVKYPVPLVDKKELSHDTRRFRFGLPTEQYRLGLPVGQHINLITKTNDELVIRAYTPVSSDDETGYFDLVVKVYFKNTHPKFPDGGKMTQYLENMKIGDCIDVRGPNGLLVYSGPGTFTIRANKKTPPEIRTANKVGMIAGGSGLTPMYQLIKHALKNPSDKTQFKLIYANQTPDDILCREDLELWTRQYPDRVSVYYTVDRPTEGWKGGIGFVNADMMKTNLPPPSDDTIILMCGPPPMIKFACIPNLDALGYTEKMKFSY